METTWQPGGHTLQGARCRLSFWDQVQFNRPHSWCCKISLTVSSLWRVAAENIPLFVFTWNISITEGSDTLWFNALLSSSNHISLYSFGMASSSLSNTALAELSAFRASFIFLAKCFPKVIKWGSTQLIRERENWTHTDHLHEVRVIHLEVKKLLVMQCGHCAGWSRNNIEDGPECFDNFSIYPSDPWNK